MANRERREKCMVAIDLLWEGYLVRFEYAVGIHDNGDYDELENITLNNPVSIGDCITMHHGDDEWQVFNVIHSPEYSILHVKAPD